MIAVDWDRIAAKTSRTREEQGLSPTCTDPVVCASVAELMRPWLEKQTPVKPSRDRLRQEAQTTRRPRRPAA